MQSINKNRSILKRFGATTILIWTIFIGTLLAIQINNHNRGMIKEATNEAKDYYRLNLFYRAWAAKMGGVYVPAEKAAPNPYLKVPNRDITTSDNRQFTLVNPAYMTRMVFEEILADSSDPIINKITSLKPLNPVNTPDEWEQQSLMAFDRKEYTERSQETEISGKPYLRFISAFTTDESCLKCHAHQGYKVGDVRGAIVISVPLSKRYEQLRQANRNIFMAYGLLWLVGSSGIAFASKRRMRDEEAVQQEHARAQIYLETVEAMIVSLDSDGRITAVNRKACQILGYREDELLGSSWFSSCLPQPEGTEIVYPHFLKIMASELGSAEYHENSIITKSGELRLIAWHNALLRNIQGQAIGTISAGEDITERKQAEDGLRRLNRELRAISDCNQVLVRAEDEESLLDAICTIVCEKAGYRMAWVGYAEQDEANTVRPIVWAGAVDNYLTNARISWSDTERGKGPTGTAIRRAETVYLQDYTTDPHIAPWREKALACGYRSSIALPLKNKNGTAFGALTIYSSEANAFIPDEIRMLEELADDLAFGIMVLRTHTEKKRIEESLRESEQRTHEALEFNSSILKTSSIGILTYHADGQCIFANEAAAIIAGTNVESLLAQNFFHEIRTWQAAGMYEAALKALNTDVEQILETHVTTTFGKDIWVSINFSSLSMKNEKHLLMFTQDITEAKHAEKEKYKLESQLHQAQKMESVGRLAGGVAHDFNNMLSVIMGHAELGLMHLDPTNPVCADLKEISKTAERSADLTRQLLTFARKQTVSPKVIDLNETVTNMLKMLQRLIGEDIHLIWQPSPDQCLIKMDPSQIDQILANLCVNARDAIEDTGRITIKTDTCSVDANYCGTNPEATPGEYVRLFVSDNGKGMDRDTLAHVFEPFYTTKEMGKGTGLGLATVYGAVTQNNGFINVYSEPDKGTTFSIHLPHVALENVHAQAEGASQTALRGQETILLVEDEAAILNITATMLEKLGYSVLRADSPGLAMELARDHHGEIHLLMTDVIMPDMNGRDLARNILSFHPDMQLLFMSGYTADIIAHHGVLDDEVHFIQKPFSLPKMSLMVREVLDSN